MPSLCSYKEYRVSAFATQDQEADIQSLRQTHGINNDNKFQIWCKISFYIFTEVLKNDLRSINQNREVRFQKDFIRHCSAKRCQRSQWEHLSKLSNEKCESLQILTQMDS